MSVGVATRNGRIHWDTKYREEFVQNGYYHDTAERAVVSACLSEEFFEHAVRTAQIDPLDFLNLHYRILYAGIREVFNTSMPFDTRLIINFSNEWAARNKVGQRIDEAFVTDLGADTDLQRGTSYLGLLKKESDRRRLLGGIFTTAEGLDTTTDVSSLIDEVMDLLSESSPTMSPITVVSGKERGTLFVDQMMERRRQRENNALRLPRWPWLSWNDFVEPLMWGTCGILVGPDGAGKSTYLDMIGESWAAQHFRVAVVHLEDSPEYKEIRFANRHMVDPIPVRKYLDGTLSDDELSTVKRCLESKPWRGNITYIHAPGASWPDIARQLDKVNPELVVVDYLDKIRPTTMQAKLPDYRQSESIMEDIKIYAERSRISILTASQGNKTIMTANANNLGRQMMSGGSGKSHKAQFVGMFTREVYEHETTTGYGTFNAGEMSPVITFRVVKQNMGRTGNLPNLQVFNGRKFLIGDLPKPQERKTG